MNSSQLLIQITRLNLSGLIFFLIIEHPIVLNEDALGKLDHFETNQQRNTNKVHHDQKPFAEILED